MASIKINNKNIVTQSGSDEPAIASNVTFPDGHVTNFISRRYELASNHTYTNNAGAERVATRESSSSAVVPNFTAKQGYTYRIEFNFQAIAGRTGGNNSGRRAQFRLYYDTTSRSQGDSTIGGTDMIAYADEGRNLTAAASSGSQDSHMLVYLNGSFYHSGSNATIYVYYTSQMGSTDFTVYTYQTATIPANLMITEFKGNSSSIVT